MSIQTLARGQRRRQRPHRPLALHRTKVAPGRAASSLHAHRPSDDRRPRPPPGGAGRLRQISVRAEGGPRPARNDLGGVPPADRQLAAQHCLRLRREDDELVVLVANLRLKDDRRPTDMHRRTPRRGPTRCDRTQEVRLRFECRRTSPRGKVEKRAHRTCGVGKRHERSAVQHARGRAELGPMIEGRRHGVGRSLGDLDAERDREGNRCDDLREFHGAERYADTVAPAMATPPWHVPWSP